MARVLLHRMKIRKRMRLIIAAGRENGPGVRLDGNDLRDAGGVGGQFLLALDDPVTEPLRMLSAELAKAFFIGCGIQRDAEVRESHRVANDLFRVPVGEVVPADLEARLCAAGGASSKFSGPSWTSSATCCPSAATLLSLASHSATRGQNHPPQSSRNGGKRSCSIFRLIRSRKRSRPSFGATRRCNSSQLTKSASDSSTSRRFSLIAEMPAPDEDMPLPPSVGSRRRRVHRSSA